MKIHCIILTIQTDTISHTNRTFSLKINKLSTFSEITQVLQCLKIAFIILTSHYVPNVRYCIRKVKPFTTRQKITQQAEERPH